MTKYNLIFTLDYEIHGNGDGNPMELMVEPTYRLMDLLEKYHQKLTIMADVAEILCFKRYAAETGKDDYHVADIEAQLCDAIRRGHEVQLHIHSSYFKAQWKNGVFDQCIEEYNMAALPYERIDEMVSESVGYLEKLLQPIKKEYKVWLFRAANWSMMPTENLYRVLVKHGITHDTSVFKGGVQGGNVCYDYREAYDNLFAYPASMANINERDEAGHLIEMPIYTEMRPFWDFVSPIRVFRMVRAKFHKHKKSERVRELESERVRELKKSANKDDNRKLSLKSFFRLSPLKMDFNQVSSRGLKRMMRNVMRRGSGEECKVYGVQCKVYGVQCKDGSGDAFRIDDCKLQNSNLVKGTNISNIGDKEERRVDVVLIGHSKTFIPYNEKTLEPFLKWYVKLDK